MRQSESDYWDGEANARIFDDGRVSDNLYKRTEIVKRLLDTDFLDQRVLEIGVGLGTSMAAVRIAVAGKLEYECTDVSPKFCDFVRDTFRFNAHNTDILNLPTNEEGFTRIVCLDSLEHVKPGDREAGYAEMNRVMAPHCSILINMPVEETHHNLEFDHEFGVQDIKDICRICNTIMTRYELYTTKVGRYVWVELVR